MKTRAPLGRTIGTGLRYFVLGVLASACIWYAGRPIFQEFQTSFAMREFREYGVLGTYRKHFFSFLGNLHEMRDLDEENERLNSKVAKLEVKLEKAGVSREETEAEVRTEELAAALKDNAGSELARTLDSIHYKPPAAILPEHLYALGLTYFRKAEYEQSAVIFSELTKLKDDESYQKAEHFLLTGISWYKLKQYHLAEAFFAKAREKTDWKEPKAHYVLVWEAILAKATGKKQLAEAKLEQLLAQFPQSSELKAMNCKRVPASREAYEPGIAIEHIMDRQRKLEREAREPSTQVHTVHDAKSGAQHDVHAVEKTHE